MSKFLENLKNAVDCGEFNSDAAKRIVEIDKLANNINGRVAEESIRKRLDDSGIKTIDEDKIPQINSESEARIQEMINEDKILNYTSNIINLENEIYERLDKIVEYIKNVEDNYEKNNPNYNNVFEYIEGLKNRYSFFINK